MGLVALQHVGSSWTRNQTRMPCTGMQILNLWTTGEVPQMTLLNLARGFSFYKTQRDRILASVSLCPQKVAQFPPQSRPSTNLS